MKYKLIIAIALAAAAAAFSLWKWAAPAPAAAPVRSPSGYYIWTVANLKAGLAHKDFTLVNVHTPFEGRIDQTDLEIPYDQIEGELDELPKEKNAKLVLYCRSGRMSEIAATQLAQLGYTNVASVTGGMAAWEADGGKLLNP